MIYNLQIETDKKTGKEMRFAVRPDTSDSKSVREVVGRRGYASHGFTPQEGEYWLDLGANVGAFSVWAATHGAYVHAFEPEPDCATLAQHNIDINGLARKVRLERAGVWADDTVTTATLSINGARGNVWRSSLVKQWRGGTNIEVPIVSVVPHWQPDVCVKMDIEGIEMPILEALAEQRVQRLVFEWSFDIDTSLERFRAVVARLRNTYDQVKGVPSCTATGEVWQPSWFPPCATIYCW